MNIRLFLVLASVIFSSTTLNASLPPQKRTHTDGGSSPQTSSQPGTCPICLEEISHSTAPDIENGETVYGCSRIHLFHHDCIFDHEGSRRCSTCPVCGLNAAIIIQRAQQPQQVQQPVPPIPPAAQPAPITHPTPTLPEGPLRTALTTLITTTCPGTVRPAMWARAISHLVVSNGTILNLMLTTLTTPELAAIINALPAIVQTSIEHLFVNSTELIALPPEIQFLINLIELSAECNRLTTLPAEIRFLTHLKQLDLHSNRIETLSHEIGAMAQLTDLDLRHNKLRHLPVEIGNLINLENLYASDNRLEEVPDQIGNLIHLKQLWLSFNSLENIPLTLQHLTELETLYLHLNLFSHTEEVKEQLRQILPSLTQLETLEIDDPITIPAELTHAHISYTPGSARAHIIAFQLAHGL